MLSPLSCPSKKQLRVGAACWLCAGPLPELPAWLGRYARVLLLSARRATLPPAARAFGQPGRGERARRPQIAPLAGSDDAEARRCAHRAASRRCGGFAQSRGRRRSFDTGRSDPCARHQQGSCGRRFVRRVRVSAEKTKSSVFLRLAHSAAFCDRLLRGSYLHLPQCSCIFCFGATQTLSLCIFLAAKGVAFFARGLGFDTRGRAQAKNEQQ